METVVSCEETVRSLVSQVRPPVRWLPTDAVRTTVVGEGHEGREVALAALRDDSEAGQGASLTGDVKGRVAAVVRQPRVAAGFQETVDQLGLLGDHSQVEGGLRGKDTED